MYGMAGALDKFFFAYVKNSLKNEIAVPLWESWVLSVNDVMSG